jgi:hypothetical protein
MSFSRSAIIDVIARQHGDAIARLECVSAQNSGKAGNPINEFNPVQHAVVVTCGACLRGLTTMAMKRVGQMHERAPQVTCHITTPSTPEQP